MATRFYFPSTGAAAVSPAFGSGWEHTSNADRRAMVTTRISSAMAEKEGVASAAADEEQLLRQYVSAALAAQTISGTIKGQVRLRRANASGDPGRLAVRIAKCDSTGATVTELLAVTFSSDTAVPPNLNLVDTATNRRFESGIDTFSISLASTAVDAGDRLIVEIGWRDNSTNLYRYAIAVFGDDSATDLAEDETTTTANNPWIEFSGDISFSGGGITGTLSQTLGNLTLSSAVKLAIDADLAKTLGNLTLSSAAQAAIDADLAGTLGNITLAGTGQLPIDADLTATLGNLSLASAFTIQNNAITGALAQTLANIGVQAAGQVIVDGDLTATLGALSLEASGALQIQASLTQTLGNLTLNASGSTQGSLTAQLAQTLGDLSLAASATLPIAGTLQATLGALSLEASGALQIQAALNQTLGNLTLEATTQPGAREISLIATLGDLTLSAYVDTGAPVPTPEAPAATGGGVLPVRYRKKPVRSPTEPTEPLQVSIVATEEPDRASLVLEMVEATGTVRAREAGDTVRMDVWQAMAVTDGRAMEPEEWVRCHMEADWTHDDRDIERIDRLLFGDAA